MLVEFFVLHFWGFLSPRIIPLPTQMPDGPKKCLETHKKDCAGDAECESAVESEIEHAEQGIKKYCK